MRWFRATLASLALVALLPLVAHASTFVHVSEVELVEGAEIIIEGQVFDQTPFQREDGVIVTDSVLRVHDVVVGAEVPQFVTVRTIGGQIGEVVVEATGFPTFRPDERLVAFLHRHPLDGTFRVLGYQLGHFRVETRPSGPPLAVPAVDGGAHFITPGGGEPPQPSPETLSALKERIRQIARDLGRDDVAAPEGT